MGSIGDGQLLVKPEMELIRCTVWLLPVSTSVGGGGDGAEQAVTLVGQQIEEGKGIGVGWGGGGGAISQDSEIIGIPLKPASRWILRQLFTFLLPRTRQKYMCMYCIVTSEVQMAIQYSQ